MVAAIRNLGRPGISSMAIAAVDNALWDLKAQILDLPLVSLLGQVRTAVPVYGSGGFTSYTVAELQKQLAGWTSSGIQRVKMKIGREPDKDIARVACRTRSDRRAIANFSSMPTAHIRANRRLRWRPSSPNRTCPGSKSLYQATISRACG